MRKNSSPNRRSPWRTFRPRLELLEDRLAPATVNWINPGGGDWDTASNWSTGQVPGASDDVIISQTGITVTHAANVSDMIHSLSSQAALAISGGSLLVNSASTLGSGLTISGGTFGGAAAITVTGLFTDNGGTVSSNGGAGSLTAQGGMNLTNSVTPTDLFDGYTLINPAGQTVVWNANMILQHGAVFNNYGTVDNQTDLWPAGMAGDALAAFNNYGTFVKSAAPNDYPFQTGIAVAFNNYGTVNLQKGVLFFGARGAPVFSSGTIVAAVGPNPSTRLGRLTLLEFLGPSTFTAATPDHVSVSADFVDFDGQTTMAGHYRAVTETETTTSVTVAFTGTVDSFGSVLSLLNGTFDLTAATLPPGATTLSSLTLSTVGTVIGAENFTVTGLFSDDGGKLSANGGAGSVTALGGMNLAGSNATGSLLFDGYTLTNVAGQTAVWNGPMALQHGAVFDNYGTVDNQGDDGMSGDALAVFNNYGTFVKSAAPHNYPSGTEIAVAFNNYGTVDDQKGVIYFGVGGAPLVSSGTILAAVGADPSTGLGRLTLLEFLGPSTFTAATSDHVSIDADFVDFDGKATIAGHYRATTVTEMTTYVNVAFTGTVDSFGSLLGVTNATLDLTAATLAPGAATLPSLILINGTVIAPQHLTVTAPFTWSGSNFVGRNGQGSLTLQGGMTITSAVSAYDFAIINPATTWTGGTVSFYGSDSSFTNTATGTFDDQVDGTFGNADGNCAPFNNQGLLVKSGGTSTTNLQMELFNTGTVTVQTGNLNLGCGYVQAPPSGGSGSSGTISGNITGSVSNPGQLNVAPAPTPPPTLSTYSQTITGSLNEEIGGLTPGTQYGQIVVTNAVNLAGSLSVVLINGFTPQNGNQFIIIDNQSTNPIGGTFNGLPEGATVLDTTGKYSFTVSYVGGEGNDLVLTAKQVATTTAVAASVNPSVLNQAVTFTGTVTPTAGSGTPTGTVQFQIDSANVGAPVTLTGGSASYSTSGLAVGPHTITAVYSGDNFSLGSSGSLTQNVDYNFSGFLPPLNKTKAFGLNRNIGIKFQLTDANGAFISTLSAVTSLQVESVDSAGNPLAPPFTPASNTGLTYDTTANQYVFNWQTKGLSAGYYRILLTLNDGTLNTKTIQLATAKAGAQVADGSTATTTTGGLLGGDIELYVDNSSGLFSSDELARINDAVAAVDATLAPYAVTITEVTDSTVANVTLDTGSTSAVGGYADGVLGCWNPAGEITLVQGWNWYAGSDPTQIGAGQYDFQTTVTHELGHALGLGESSDPTSAMYASLATGTVIRNLTTADLAIPYTGTGADAMHAAVPPVLASVTLERTRLEPGTFNFFVSGAAVRFSNIAVAPPASAQDAFPARLDSLGAEHQDQDSRSGLPASIPLEGRSGGGENGILPVEEGADEEPPEGLPPQLDTCLVEASLKLAATGVAPAAPGASAAEAPSPAARLQSALDAYFADERWTKAGNNGSPTVPWAAAEDTDLACLQVQSGGSPAIAAAALAVVLSGYWAQPTKRGRPRL